MRIVYLHYQKVKRSRLEILDHQNHPTRRKLGISQKVQDQNKWVSNVWCDWVKYWLWVPYVEEEENQYQLVEDFHKISTKAMLL